MMYSTNVQLAKWTFPAAALIIGLYWYRRRRAHRADPGGTAKLDYQDNMVSSRTREIDTSLYDPDIRETGESFSMSCYAQQEAPARVPRKVSESMDIPVRKSPSQSSCDSSQTLCADDEPLHNTSVQLGSNPSTSYFETIARRQSASAFESAGNDRRVFEEVTEEVQYTVKCEMEPSERIQDTAAEYSHAEDRQLTEQQPEDSIKTQGQGVYERDSANHSPISGVLDGSIPDEVRSEGSTDSGKGGSINGCRKTNQVTPTTYYFAIPQHLVGRLIGRHGSFLHSIRTKAEILIYVNDHPSTSDQKICSIEGSPEGINVALDMIRKKFPEKRFPQVTLAEISTPEVIPVMTEGSWIPQWTQLFLVDGVNNDILVSHLHKPHWLFVQLPTHPTYPYLGILVDNMTYMYANTELPLPSVLTRGMIYAVFWCGHWVRAFMETPDPLGKQHILRVVDFGGYYSFSTLEIRDIMPEYLSLPFQAIEIFLANVRLKNGICIQKANDVLGAMCFGIVGQAQVESYAGANVYTNVYFSIQKYGVISLADEVIARGYAEPTEPLEEISDIVSETSVQLYQDTNVS